METTLEDCVENVESAELRSFTEPEEIVQDTADDKLDIAFGRDRDTWSNRLDSTLSLLGYAVGLGNLWRFPYLCMKNGGGAFLVPFLICLVVCGMPLFFLEVSLGQFLGKSSIHVWAVFPLVKGIGFGMFVINVVICLYYTMIMSWTLYYLANSFQSTLPWSTCGNPWNTGDCIIKDKMLNEDPNVTMSTNGNNSTHDYNRNGTTLVATLPTIINNTGKMSAEEEFWQYRVLNISDGFENFGKIQWHLVLVLAISWLLLFLCVIKGVKSIGKVVYVTALLPYLLLTAFLLRGLTLEGSVDGIVYFLKPEPAKLMQTHVWIEAALQVFYSLGPGWGPLIAMASHNKFKNNCLRDALVVSFVGEGTSVYSGLVVFTILGFIAHELGLPIEKVVKSGPGLGFVAYPQALARLPLPQLWSVLFFLMLLTVGLDSQFANVECILTGITDIFPRFRKRQYLVLLAICVAGFVLGLPVCFQGGLYLFQLYDWYIAILSVPLFGFLEAVIISWFYGLGRFSHDVELMIGRGIPLFIRVCLCFIAPGIIACCFVFTLWVYEPPTYGSYMYPGGAELLGWIIAVVPLLPLVISALHYFIKRRGKPLKETCAMSLQPSNDWRPNCIDHQLNYKMHKYSFAGRTILQRIKINVLGE